MASALAGSALAASRLASGRVSGLDDGFQRFAFVLHVAFDGLDQIRDEVVAPGELNVDLGEGVPYAVALVDETVVYADGPENQRCDQREDYEK